MKKLLALIGIVFLSTVSVFAFHVKSRVKPRKPLPIITQKTTKPIPPMPSVNKVARNIVKNAPLSWIDYLRNLQMIAADLTTYDFQGNIHPYLLEADTKDEEDKKISFSLTDYQAISGYFQEVYQKDPQQGTLEEYKEFYKKLNDISPREHYILPTIAVWQTGSVEAVLPYRHQMTSYWETPQLAAKAYDVMSSIDPVTTQNAFQKYMRFTVGDEENPENRGAIKAFFDTWRAQEDKTLPSVQNANELEHLVLAN